MPKRALAAALLVGSTLQAQSADLPAYRVHRTVDAIRIDGTLDEATWAMLPRVGAMRLNTDPPRQPVRPTEAALAWDASNLYVAFSCSDPEPWGRMKNRDEFLWQEEVVEVFLDPDGDGQNYAELEVSPNNVVVDLKIPSPKSLAGENVRTDIPGLRSAVTRHQAGWIAEIAIPWSGLSFSGVSGPPKLDERWRAGLYRIERPGGPVKADQIAKLVTEQRTATNDQKPAIDKRLVELRANDEYSAWSVTHPERGFHDPERFGYLQFVD